MKFILVYYFIFLIHFIYIDLNFSKFDLFLYFLNVGQGDAALIKAQDSTLIVDGGPDYTLDYSIDNKIPFFMCDIDYVVATHPHKDHIQGLTRIMKRCSVKTVLINKVAYASQSWQDFKNEAITNSLLLSFPELPKSLSSVYKTEYFAADSLSCKSDVNVCSLILLITIKSSDKKVLLTGDAPVQYLPALNKHIDIIKVPHHGGSGTLSDTYLLNTSPSLAILSYGVHNRYGHPHTNTLNLLNQYKAKTIHTSNGDILVKVPR